MLRKPLDPALRPPVVPSQRRSEQRIRRKRAADGRREVPSKRHVRERLVASPGVRRRSLAAPVEVDLLGRRQRGERPRVVWVLHDKDAPGVQQRNGNKQGKART